MNDEGSKVSLLWNPADMSSWWHDLVCETLHVFLPTISPKPWDKIWDRKPGYKPTTHLLYRDSNDCCIRYLTMYLKWLKWCKMTKNDAKSTWHRVLGTTLTHKATQLLKVHHLSNGEVWCWVLKVHSHTAPPTLRSLATHTLAVWAGGGRVYPGTHEVRVRPEAWFRKVGFPTNELHQSLGCHLEWCTEYWRGMLRKASQLLKLHNFSNEEVCWICSSGTFLLYSCKAAFWIQEMSPRLSDVERSVVLQSVFAIHSTLTYLCLFQVCPTPPHIQVCHCTWSVLPGLPSC